MPLVNWPDSADDRFNIQLPAGQQCQNSFPDRPVVTKAALQCHVLLHKRIQIKAQRLWAPTNFADPASRTNNVDRNLQRGTRPRRVDNAVATKTVSLTSPLGGISDDTMATVVVLCDLQSMPIRFQPNQRDFGSA